MTHVPDWWLSNRKEFEKQCHKSAWQNSAENALLFGKLWTRLRVGDESVCPHITRDGYWESWVSLAVARVVKPGWRVVDIGAHVGWYTMLALARGAEKVVAIDPQVEMIQLLNDTLRQNGMKDKVSLLAVAVGVMNRQAQLLTYGTLTGSASLYPAVGWSPKGQEQVEVYTLDDALEPLDFGRIDLIKVDVEGAEASVWDGMTGTRDANPEAVVVMEVGSPRGYNLESFLLKIKDSGYPLRYVNYDGEVVDTDIDTVLANAKDLPTLWLQR